MASTAGFLSSYQSINFSISSSSIVCLAKLTNRKRRLTLNSEGNPQQLTMELASIASLSFIMVRKRQLLGSCAVRDHWSWPGASLYFTFTFENYGEYGSADPLQLLLPYTDLEKNLLFNFHCSFRMVSSPREALILFRVMSRNSSESSAISIAYNSLKLNKITSVVYIRTVFILLVCFSLTNL